MVLHLWLLKGIYWQCNCSQKFILIWGVCKKICIYFSEFSSWEPFVDQLHDLISLINTESRRRLIDPKNQVLKDRFLLNFNLKCFITQLSEFSKGCLIFSSIKNITIRKFKLGDSSIIEYLNVHGMRSCAFLVFHNCNHGIK